MCLYYYYRRLQGFRSVVAPALLQGSLARSILSSRSHAVVSAMPEQLCRRRMPAQLGPLGRGSYTSDRLDSLSPLSRMRERGSFCSAEYYVLFYVIFTIATAQYYAMIQTGVVGAQLLMRRLRLGLGVCGDCALHAEQPHTSTGGAQKTK